MSNPELKIILYCALTASAILAIVILLLPDDLAPRGGAVFALFGCGLLAGMSWQTMICRKHDAYHAAKKEAK